MLRIGTAALIVFAMTNTALADIVTGTDEGLISSVKLFDSITTAEIDSFMPYGGAFTGGVRVAAGDVTGDGPADIVTGAGPSAGGHVKVFDGSTGLEVRSFFAYGPSYSGGVFVGAGDVNHDLKADIVTGADQGVPSHVKVFDGASNLEIKSFFAYGAGFQGGVRVAAGDINGDGFADIITGAGNAGNGHVKVFDAISNSELRSFFAYGGGFTGGVFVAGGDVSGDGRADIITGTDDGTAAHVKVFDGLTGSEIRSFFAFDVAFTGGVRVAAGDVNADGFADIIAGGGPGSFGHVKVFDGSTGLEIRSFFGHGARTSIGVYVASTDPVVPEPSSICLLLMATFGALWRRGRRCS
jgi:serralysin